MTDNLCTNREVYALGGLNEEETRQFEAHLASCPECQAEVANLRLVTEQLLLDFEDVPVPKGMRGRILENILGEEAPSRPVAVEEAPSRPIAVSEASPQAVALPDSGGSVQSVQHDGVSSTRVPQERAFGQRSRRAWGPWTSAAAVVIVALIASMSYVTGSRSTSPIGQVTKSMALTATTSSGSAKMWVTSSSAGKQMLMHFSNLKKVSGQQVYQVWLIPNGQAPVSAGVFTPDANGNAVFASLMPAGSYQVVAVTLEPKAIDAQPLGSIVFKGSLT